MTGAVGRNPMDALDYAHAEGGLSSQEYADRLQQLDDSRQLSERMDRLAEQNRRYTAEDRMAELQHEQLQWERQQIESRRADKREDRHNQISANIELLKLFADNGHLDTYNADIEDLIRRIRGDKSERGGKSGPGMAAGKQQPELTGGQAEHATRRATMTTDVTGVSRRQARSSRTMPLKALRQTRTVRLGRTLVLDAGSACARESRKTSWTGRRANGPSTPGSASSS